MLDITTLRTRSARGQVLPIWLATCMFALLFGFMLLQYGQSVAYESRAQTAADAVARAAVSVQSEQFNEMLATLYVNGVEEYRIRHLIESIRILSGGAGGCETPGHMDCATTWAQIRQAWLRSLNRYEHNARLLNEITANMNFNQYKSNATTLVNQMNQNCVAGSGSSGGGSSLAKIENCGRSYSNYRFQLTGFQQRGGLSNALEDATNIVLPSYSATGPVSCATYNCDMFLPVSAEVTVCAKVPSFFNINLFPAVYVYARGAATDAMIEQDWLEPGQQQDPWTGRFLQPFEKYGDDDASNLSSGGHHLNWYSINFGGTAKAVSGNTNTGSSNLPQNSTINATINAEQFLARTGWWGPVPIIPFTAPKSQAQIQAMCP